MKRMVAVLFSAGMILTAAPAGAHLDSHTDGENDSFQAGDVNTTAHVTPLDLSGASFKEKRKAYKVTMTFHDPLDMDLLCSNKTCSGDTIESHGALAADFYRVKNDERKNWYFVEVGNDGSGNPIAAVFKVTDEGADQVDNATATLSDDGLTMKISAPRAKIKGQTEGRKIFWNSTSLYWHAAKTGYCEFDTKQAFAGACVDWIPDASDSEHKLQN